MIGVEPEFDSDDVIRWIKDTILISAGVLSASFGLKGFLLPNHFVDGGVTGISLLVKELTRLPLALLIVLINIPFVVMGYRHISKAFGLKTLVAILALAVCLVFISYPIITKDKLLISVFGGFFLGMGIGLSIRGGAVIDGTEVLALVISRRIAFSIGDIILVINVIIFFFAAMILSLENALYSILTYLSAAKTVDFINNGIEEYVSVIIISKKSEEIRHFVTEELGIGMTLYKGRQGYGRRGVNNHDIEIIFSVITRLELAKLKQAVDDIDEKALVIEQSVNDVKGGIIRKRLK